MGHCALEAGFKPDSGIDFNEDTDDKELGTGGDQNGDEVEEEEIDKYGYMMEESENGSGIDDEENDISTEDGEEDWEEDGPEVDGYGAF